MRFREVRCQLRMLRIFMWFIVIGLVEESNKLELRVRSQDEEPGVIYSASQRFLNLTLIVLLKM